MFGLLNSTWLFALAGLIIPVLIHLWNIRPGKTLKVGSIALIAEASRKSSRSLKLTDLLLLVIRCLLLALLAFLLAKPYLQQTISAQNIKGWLLIPKENLREGYAKFKTQVDSLDKAGYEFHYFDKDFAKGDLKKIAADSTIKDSATGKPANYWGLLGQLENKVPGALPVYLITPNGLNHFTGNKPTTALNIKWKTYTPSDSTSTWIEKAWFTNNNDMQVTTGSSKPSGTSFTNYAIKTGEEANTPFVVNVSNGHPMVSLKNSKQAPVTIDIAATHIAIFTDKYAIDADYVKAALTAASQFGGHKSVVKLYANAPMIPVDQDWIFWLSEQKVGADILQKGKNILAYEDGKPATIDSWIRTDAASNQQEKIALFKLISIENKTVRSLWQDGFGRTVLGSDRQGQTSVYHFYNHFNPVWNDLVWSDAFPKQLLRLLSGNNALAQNISYDRRVMDNAQIQPDQVKTPGNNTPVTLAEQKDLSHYFWLILVIVFFVERWLAHRNKLTTANG